ncbi:MAG: hypothetical protein OQK73_11290 [Gammaproteobacteria bacterium]|nr:hypothetical protein [Gammaproteobacteria bacterium]
MDELSAEAGSAPVAATKQKNKVKVLKSQGEYVDSLMDEADGLTIDKMTTLEEKEIKKIEITDDSSWNFDEQSLGILESGMSQSDFEKSLKRNYFATSILFSKLDPVSKSMVYKAYLETPEIEHITKVISGLAR